MFIQLMSDNPFRAWRYMSEDEIVTDLLTMRLTKEDKEALVKLEYDALVTVHWSFGRYIKETYRLNEPDHPLVAKRSADETAVRLIERVWATITNKEIPIKDSSKAVVSEEKEDIHLPFIDFSIDC